jgi:hypothetical protein
VSQAQKTVDSGVYSRSQQSLGKSSSETPRTADKAAYRVNQYLSGEFLQKLGRWGEKGQGRRGPRAGAALTSSSYLSSSHISPLGVVGTNNCKIKWAVGGRCSGVYVPGEAGRGGGGIKNEITEFSAASQRALNRLVASIDQSKIHPDAFRFLTLTYHKDYPTARASKSHLDTLLKRFERHWGPRAMFWKIEPQGRGAPHFHLLILMDSAQAELELSWWASNWCDVIGEAEGSTCWKWHMGMLGGTNKPCISTVRDWSGVGAYCAKYLGKRCKLGEDWQTPGRWWGVRRREMLPIALHEEEVSAAVAFKVKRNLVRFYNSTPTGVYICRNSRQVQTSTGKTILVPHGPRQVVRCKPEDPVLKLFAFVKPRKRKWKRSSGGLTVFLSDESILRLMVNAWDDVGSCDVYSLPPDSMMGCNTPIDRCNTP